MLRSKPIKRLLALILAAAAAVAGWKGWKSWQRLTGRGDAAFPPGDAQQSSGSVAADTTVPATQAHTHAPESTTDVDASAWSSAIADDQALATAGDEAGPEPAGELPGRLPEPDLSSAGPGDETPAADEPALSTAETLESASEPKPASAPEPAPASDDGVDQVLGVVAAEADTKLPSSERRVEPSESRFGPNSITADEGGDCPPEYPVKGNTNSMIFHLPGQSSYAATMAEVCFSDGDAAEAAGFRPRKR